ncbi:PLC-like phosphodiesterase [Podospora australis]|uniref:PLC-like phosphodiesterase n=1 Tax=Podospora australis TaxID=1536484 RepID=A0AAN7ANN9_9PEZI|nr:PLC-like phosphodiesterase [Podospora australis]
MALSLSTLMGWSICLLLMAVCTVAATPVEVAVVVDDRPPLPSPLPPLALGDHAVQKVLKNAEDVFGVYNYPPGRRSDSRFNRARSEWMARVPNNTPLTALNIPGTHASATWNFSKSTRDSIPHNTDDKNKVLEDADFYRCQTSSIVDSLDAGIRFFDLHVSLDPSWTKLVFWHTNALLSNTATLEDVLFGFYAWLEAHPSELLFLSLKYEPVVNQDAKSEAAPDDIAYNLLFSLLTSKPSRRFIFPSKVVPKYLGHVRGRIVLIRRFDFPEKLNGKRIDNYIPGVHLSPKRWVDNSKVPFRIEIGDPRLGSYVSVSDYHHLIEHFFKDANHHIDKKIAVVENHLNQARDMPFGDGLFITFASAEHYNNVPRLNPKTIAWGDDGKEKTFKGGVNQHLIRSLRRKRGERVGIVVVDFWDGPGDVVGAILGDWN